MSESAKSAWDSYRRWKRFEYAPFGIWFIIALFPQTFIISGPLFAVLICILAVKVNYFNCPQCEDPFFYGSGFIHYKGWAKACVHCGHPKWAEPIPKPPYSNPHPWPPPKAKPDPKEQSRNELTTFPTLVLASDPSSICLKVDHEGWADLDHLIARSNFNGLSRTRDQIVDLLVLSVNTGFELTPTESRIRCIRS